jgi:hypothetical protein
VKDGIVPSIEAANGESKIEDDFPNDRGHLLYDLEWWGVGGFLERLIVEVGAFLEVMVVEEVLWLVGEEGSGGRPLREDRYDKEVVDGCGSSNLWVVEEVDLSEGSGCFNEPGGDGFKDDGGGRGFKTLEGDDFKEDKVVSVEVAADPEYVQEEEGFGFKV